MIQKLYLLFILGIILLSPKMALAGKDDWKPIDPAHMALKAPIVEKDADAEAIFWEVKVQDELYGQLPQTVLNHYLRIKIFTERGRESESRIDIPFLGNYRINDIAGRTIKPDGTIVELKKDAIFERTILKANGLKIKAKSFAMPAVEPGSIIEYRWQEVRVDSLAYYIHLDFQRDIPVQSIKYYIKPLSLPYLTYGMRVKTFNGVSNALTKEKDGFYSATMTNVPAFHEESYMPPEDTVRPWMLVYYSEDKTLAPDPFWADYAKKTHESVKDLIKPNDNMRKAVATIVAEGDEPYKKLEKIFLFCRNKIKNASYLKVSESEMKQAKNNKTPNDTLKTEIGSGLDIDLLFAALINAAGMDARIAKLTDRSKNFFDRNFTDDFFMKNYLIAVKLNNNWAFFDPGSLGLPYGMLRWQDEAQDALICDPKEPVFVKTPLSGPEKSLKKRTARLKLLEDGTLEGTVRVEYTGQFDAQIKADIKEDSTSEREESIKADLVKRLKSAEVSDIKVENAEEYGKNYVYSYKVRIANYAQKTGKRLFIQPAFFQNGADSIFASSDRKHPIYFPFPWSEIDTINVELPAGYALENPTVPAPFSAGEVSKYNARVQITTDKRVLIFTRTFSFGDASSLFFPNSSYSQLKHVFDTIQERDKHTLTLKQNPPTEATTSTTPDNGGAK